MSNLNNEVNFFKNLILDNLPYIIWIRDLNNKYIYANDNFCNYHNISLEDLNKKDPIELLEESQRNIVNEATKKVLKDLKPVEYIVNYKDDFFQCVKKPFYEKDKPIGILCCATNISKTYIEKLKLEKDKKLLQAVFDNVPDVIFFKDLNSVYLGCNKQCTDNSFKGKTPEYVIGKTDYDLHPAELAKTFIERDKHLLKTLKTEVTHVNMPIKNGEVLYMENIKSPLFLDGELVGLVGISRNISYRKKLENKLYNLSYKDPLTGLYNRTYFNDRKTALYDEDYFPLSLIMGDINGLKIVNDSLGHENGDKLIISITNILKDCCNEDGYVFRIGGDELVMLLPKTTLEEANKIITKIYKECENSSSSNIPLSISLGSSTITSFDTTIDEALNVAEDKVYRHKLLKNESFRSSFLSALQRSLFEKSEETEQHTERLQKYAIEIGKDLGLSSDELDNITLLCNLHDIGKIGVPEEILKKSSELTPEEYDIMKLHCEKGFRITERIPELSHISKAILAHHERWDGKGYPLNLKGEEIPLISRIVAVVDAYDAMVNDRIYRKSIGKEAALEEIKENSGTQFDPKIVESFLKIMEKHKGI